MKTVSVALVLCLNVGVDPPDVIKTRPCSRLECWKGKELSVNVDLLDLYGKGDLSKQLSFTTIYSLVTNY